MDYFAYILQSEKDGRFYKGQTQNLQKRLEYHNKGRSKYTKNFLPWKLYAYKVCDSRSEAIKFEKNIIFAFVIVKRKYVRKKDFKLDNTFIFTFFGLIWLYLWLRAIYIPFVVDEISTFFHYIQVGEFLPWKADLDANNHILNSALSILSYKIFGLSELSLRLPNLLFAPLLFYAVYKISFEFTNRTIALFFIIVMIANHFFIEYLALSRGYGMSMSLMMLSIWFTVQLVKHDKLIYYLLVPISIFLYLAANLTLINTALFTIVVITFNAIINNSDKLRQLFVKLFFITVLGIIPFALALFYLFVMKEKNLLMYGITGSFIHVTVETLFYTSTGIHHYFVTVMVIIIFTMTAVTGIYKIWRTKTIKELSSPALLFFLLLLFNLTMTISLHYLFDIKYPEDRVGLFFIPLFLGSFLFMIDYLIQKTGNKRLVFISVPVLAIPIFFFINLNLSYSLYWKDQSISKTFYNEIKNKKTDNGFPVNIGSRELTSNLWSMQNYRAGGICNPINYADSASITDDYLIENYDVNPQLRTLYDSLGYNELSNEHLLCRKYPAKKVRFGHINNFSTDSMISKKYFLIYRGWVNRIAGKEVLATLKMTFESPAKPYRGAIVLQYFGKKRKMLGYNIFYLNKLKSDWDGLSGNFIYGLKTKPVPENSTILKIYLYNIKNQPYEIKDGEISVYYYLCKNN